MPISNQEKQRLVDTARNLRLTIIDVMAWSGGAHVGGSLSIADILTILYFKYLNVDPKNPKWEDRDRFVLSKGHAAAGFIPVLAEKGFFPKEELKTFNHFGSPFAMHPDSNKVIGCDVSAGSLGHGLSIAAGLGLGGRYLKKAYKRSACLGRGSAARGKRMGGGDGPFSLQADQCHYHCGPEQADDRRQYRGRYVPGALRGQMACVWP